MPVFWSVNSETWCMRVSRLVLSLWETAWQLPDWIFCVLDCRPLLVFSKVLRPFHTFSEVSEHRKISLQNTEKVHESWTSKFFSNLEKCTDVVHIFDILCIWQLCFMQISPEASKKKFAYLHLQTPGTINGAKLDWESIRSSPRDGLSTFNWLIKGWLGVGGWLGVVG